MTMTLKQQPMVVALETDQAQETPPRTLRQWVDQCVNLCRPGRIQVCGGRASERSHLLGECVRLGELTPLGMREHPGWFIHDGDVHIATASAQRVFVCAPNPSNALAKNWSEPKAAHAQIRGLFDGCMKGRTMYVVPFVIGAVGSPTASVGIQLTDSPLVALLLGLSTPSGAVAWRQLGQSERFVRCVHGAGMRPQTPRYFWHFPAEDAVWSLGGGVGGDVLLKLDSKTFASEVIGQEAMFGKLAGGLPKEANLPRELLISRL